MLTCPLPRLSSTHIPCLNSFQQQPILHLLQHQTLNASLLSGLNCRYHGVTLYGVCMGCLDHTNCSGGLLLCEESGMTWPTQYKTLVSHTQVNIFTAKFLHNSLHHAKIRSLYLNPKVRYAYLEIRPNNYNHYRNVNMSYSSCTTYLLTQPLEENTGSLIFVARSQTALTYLYCLVLLP